MEILLWDISWKKFAVIFNSLNYLNKFQQVMFFFCLKSNETIYLQFSKHLECFILI